MNLDLSTQYYLKAMDYYPHNLEFAIENLQYALSYYPDHHQALCLLGQIHMYQLKDYKMAMVCFQNSIAAEPNYPDPYKLLATLYIWVGRYDASLKIIDFAMTRVGGCSHEALYRIKAMLYEYQGYLASAKHYLKKAKLLSQNSHCITSIKLDLSRIKAKQKILKKSIT